MYILRLLPVIDCHLQFYTVLHHSILTLIPSCSLTPQTLGHIAVCTSLLSCVQAEINALQYLLPVIGSHLWFATHLDVAQLGDYSVVSCSCCFLCWKRTKQTDLVVLNLSGVLVFPRDRSDGAVAAAGLVETVTESWLAQHHRKWGRNQETCRRIGGQFSIRSRCWCNTASELRKRT